MAVVADAGEPLSPQAADLVRRVARVFLDEPADLMAELHAAVSAAADEPLRSEPVLAAEVAASNRANVLHLAASMLKDPGGRCRPTSPPRCSASRERSAAGSSRRVPDLPRRADAVPRLPDAHRVRCRPTRRCCARRCRPAPGRCPALSMTWWRRCPNSSGARRGPGPQQPRAPVRGGQPDLGQRPHHHRTGRHATGLRPAPPAHRRRAVDRPAPPGPGRARPGRRGPRPRGPRPAGADRDRQLLLGVGLARRRRRLPAPAPSPRRPRPTPRSGSRSTSARGSTVSGAATSTRSPPSG